MSLDQRTERRSDGNCPLDCENRENAGKIAIVTLMKEHGLPK
jgi:hypothetical protein